MRGILALFFSLFLQLSSAHAQDRSKEIEALATLCSTGASMNFRGEIEIGLGRVFRNAISADGTLDVGKSETEFLESVPPSMRIEARKIYNECVLSGLSILFDKKIQTPLETNKTKLNRSNPIEISLKMNIASRITETLVASIEESGYEGSLIIRVSELGRTSSNRLKSGENIDVPGTDCFITYLGGVNTDGSFPFLYGCR